MQTKISSLYDTLLSLIIISSPLIIYGFPMFIFNMRLSRLFFIIIIPFLIARLIQKPSLIFRDKLFTYAILPYLTYTVISLAWIPVANFNATAQRLGGLFEAMLIYILLVVADLNKERFEKFIKCYLASAIIPIAIAFWQLLNNFLHYSNAEVPFTKYVIAGRYAEIMIRDYLLIGGDFSRLTATFAEPTIFGCYMCSIVLFSMAIKIENQQKKYFYIALQLVGVMIMILSFTKLAIICFVLGLLLLSIENRKYLKILLSFFVFLGFVALIMYLTDMFFLTDRLLRETGHYRLLLESLEELKKINLFLGNGFGTIARGSWHRFLISRLYESGVMGLVLTVLVTILPFKLARLKIASTQENFYKIVCLATAAAVLLGLHLYDYFIHLFPWIVIGIVSSYYCHYKNLAEPVK